MGSDVRVGWIGVGKMGNPMSRRVLSAGFPLCVLEPILENRATVVAEGAKVADSHADLAASADVIFSMIPNDRVLRELMLGPNGFAACLHPGQTFVEMSTVSPTVSAEVASALEQCGVAYLRAPVSGSTTTAAAGKLAVLVSGPEAAFRACKPIFAAFSARQFHLGAAEEARYAKLVLNTLVGATSALLAEALTLGQKGNLSVATMLDVISESAVASPLIAYKRGPLVSRNFDPAFSVSQMMKDLDLILDAARSDHIPMSLTSIIRQQYEAAYAEGLAEKDFFVLIEQSERNAGLSEQGGC
jgi:3-hydroxyisobutyrate dehydrogenase-like beta-hydroxyacid dehydrogenase